MSASNRNVSSPFGWVVGTACLLALGACSKAATEPMPTPATVVMPGSAAPAASAGMSSQATANGASNGAAATSGEVPVATDLTSPGSASTGSASTGSTSTSTSGSGLTGGTVTVLPGGAPPADPATSSVTVLPSAGIPATGTSLPAAGAIGAAASAGGNQPPSVSPGTTR